MSVTWKWGEAVCKKYLKMQKSLSDWVRGDSWKNRKEHSRKIQKKQTSVILENSKISINRSLAKIWAFKILLVNTQKEIRRAIEKTYLFLDNNYPITGIILVEIHVLNHCYSGSEGNEDKIFGNWRKEDPCYLVTEDLAGFCPEMRQKARFAKNEFVYLSEEISKQSVEGAT